MLALSRGLAAKHYRTDRMTLMTEKKAESIENSNENRKYTKRCFFKSREIYVCRSIFLTYQ